MAMAHGLTGEQVKDILDNPATSEHASDATKALMRFAEKLTKEPSKVWEQDVDDLRAAGFSDAAALEAVHVVALFNSMDRLADGTGTPAENMQSIVK